MGRRLANSLAMTAMLLATTAADSRRPEGTATGSRFVHTVLRGESLWSVGARFGIEPRALARMNRLPAEAWLRVGQQLLIDSRHIVPAAADVDVVINLPQRMLFHFTEGVVDAAYPVGLGRPSWPTFTGAFTVVALETNPVWDVPLSIQEEMRRTGNPVLTHVPPGPANPLGAFWIGLDRAGFGIHGTNAPASIYHFQTHGCIRLHPDDAAALFQRLAVGARGEIVYEPVLLTTTDDGEILLEVHPDVYKRRPNLLARVQDIASRKGLTDAIAWERVEAVLRAKDGGPTIVSR